MSPRYAETAIDESTTRELIASPAWDEAPTYVETVVGMIQLAVIFALGYSLTGWLNQHRETGLPWHAAWEYEIPYLPWLVLPYISINALFNLAPLACRDRRSLKLLVRRCCWMFGLAAAAFLAVPLRLDRMRPAPVTLLDHVADFFLGIDQTCNMVPSLHVALAIVLCEFYCNFVPRAWRTATMVWFVLIAASTLFTRQHFVIDIVGGVLLGVFCKTRITLADEASAEEPIFLPFAELGLTRESVDESPDGDGDRRYPRAS